MAGLAQEVGGGEARRAAADDADLLAGEGGGSGVELVGMGEDVVAQRALYGVDADGIAVLTLVAGALAGVRADARGEHGHGVDAHDDLGGRVPVVFADLLHIAGNIGAGRALGGAGGGVSLHAAVDGVVTVVAQDGVALLAALAHAVHAGTDAVGVTVEPAAHILADVAADGGDVADEGRGHGARGIGEHGGLGLDFVGVDDVHQLGQSADLNVVALGLDVVAAFDGLEVDDGFGIGLEDLALEDAHQVGTAGNDDFAALLSAFQFGSCFFERRGPFMFKIFHRSISSQLLKPCRGP